MRVESFWVKRLETQQKEKQRNFLGVCQSHKNELKIKNVSWAG